MSAVTAGLRGSERPGQPSRPQTVRRLRSSAAVTSKYLTLILACVVVLLPMIAVLMTALKTAKEVENDGSALTPPHNWLNYHNFVTAFNKGDMLQGLFNTGFLLVFSVTGTVLIGSMTAYAIGRFNFRFKRVVVALFLLAALVPSVTTQVATFKVINFFGLVDTRWGPILLYTGTDIVSIYIFLQFIRSIPISLDESARLDGASSFTIYRKIIFPLLKPAIATVVIIKGIFVYNDFVSPFLYMPDSNLGTVSTSLFRFKGPFGAHWEDISAGAILVVVPSLVIFLLLQKFIYNGLTRGAVK
jgi:ABC-type glycerol-3-phosphate transport system permease component